MKTCLKPLMFALCCLVLSGPASAQRAGTWELTVQLIGNTSESSDGSNGSKLDVDSDIGIAFGGAYHATTNLELGVDLSFLNPDYTATINVDGSGPQTVDTELDVFNSFFYGAWNFMEGPFSPYVRAGLGWTYIDSNIISDGLPIDVCWWDPWWGYICSGYYDTYDDTRFSYGAGLGVRYDFDRTMFLKGGFDHIEMEGEGLGADPDFGIWRMEFGWRFPTR